MLRHVCTDCCKRECEIMAKNDRTVSCNPNKRFRGARTLDEEAKVLAAAVPKATEYKNRWAVKEAPYGSAYFWTFRQYVRINKYVFFFNLT